MTDPDAYAALLDARAELSDLDAAAWLAEAHGGRLDAVTAQRRADLAVRWVIVPTLCLLCRERWPVSVPVDSDRLPRAIICGSCDVRTAAEYGDLRRPAG